MILCIICFSLAYFTYHNSSRSIHFFPYMSRFPSNGWIIYVCVCVCVCKILLPYCNIWLANIFSHSIDCFFILLIFFPFLCRSFLDGCNSICLFCFGCHCFWCQTKKKIQHQTLPRLLSMSFSHVSSRICMVSGLMFAFLIHLELIFVSSVRWLE